MGFCPPSRLTALQRDLLEQFFAREKRFHLTGGGALAGFYFGHRETEDLDFFAAPGPDLRDAAHALKDAAAACGAIATPDREFTDFQRWRVRRGDEECVVDLVIERSEMVDPHKAQFGAIRVDTLREIAANKICTLLGRSEIKDLVDLERLVREGIDLHQAFADARRKDRGAEPDTLGWVLDQMRIAPNARLPAGVDPVSLERFRADFVKMLRSEAFREASRTR